MPKFKDGNPGGPGRPKGSRNAVNVILDQLAVESAEDMVKKMVEIATEGDRVAARLVLNRVWAAPKSRPIEIELPEIRTPAELVDAHAAVVAMLRARKLTAEDLASVTRVLETYRRAFELVAQGDRVEKLETEVRRLRARFGG